jgi:hypothetical protein
MDQCDLGKRNSGFLESLHGSGPKFNIRMHWVLDQHPKSASGYGIGNLLYQEGVYRGAGSDPDPIEPVAQDPLDMAGGGNLGYYRQSGTRLCLGKPFQSTITHPLERIGAGTRLPKAGTQEIHAAQTSQLLAGRKELFAALCATWPGDD